MPYVWEYSRLNVTNTVMSKRKLNYIVTNKYVDGWDDRRLLTLAGLRQRGVTPTSINAFVRGLGITRSDGSMIHVSRLEHHFREELNKTAPRTMVVLNPLKGVLHWVPESDPVKVEVRLFEKLFNSENPAELNDDWHTDINLNLKVVVSDAYALSTIKDAVVGDTFQFERLGYYEVDKDSSPGKLVFNGTVTLRDSYKKGGEF